MTPAHIVPEWYFLPFYAILRAIPNKTLGVVAMFGALLILLLLPLTNKLAIRSNRYRPTYNILFWIFAFNFLILLWVGAKPVAQPYVMISQISTFIYFAYFILLLLPEPVTIFILSIVTPILLLIL